MAIVFVSKMKLKYITCFILIAIYVDVGHSWRCDYTYDKKADGYFKFHRTPAVWHDARTRCQFEGAVLASPDSQEMNDILVNFMNSISKISYSCFIGIHSTFYPADYHTINGTSLSKIPIKWLDTQPDNKNNAERCLIMTSEGFAADVKCNDTYPFICYKKKKEGDDNQHNCGTTDPAYWKSDETGNCYKFHMVPTTWSRASMVCSAEGGHLAVINSDEEAEFLRKLFARYPSSKIKSPVRKDLALIGFSNWDVYGDWRTVHGETLEEAGYSDFQPGDPTNRPPGIYCGCMYSSGRLCDYGFEAPAPYICEKTPNSLLCDGDDHIH